VPAPPNARAPEDRGASNRVSTSSDRWLYVKPPFFSENRRELFELIKSRDVNWPIYDELSPTALSLLQGVRSSRLGSSVDCGFCSLIHSFDR